MACGLTHVPFSIELVLIVRAAHVCVCMCLLLPPLRLFISVHSDMFSIWSACERDISRCEYVQDCGSWSFEANKYCMFLPTRTMGFCCVFTHQRDDKLNRFFLLSTRRSNKTVSRISFSHSQILTGGFLDAVVCRTKLYWRYFSLSSKNYILSPFHLSILSLILYFLFYLRSWGEYIYIY